MKLVSAKISDDLFGDVEEIRKGLGIETRNELITRSLTLYVWSCRSSANRIRDCPPCCKDGKQ